VQSSGRVGLAAWLVRLMGALAIAYTVVLALPGDDSSHNGPVGHGWAARALSLWALQGSW